jgi:hypothetical protein
MPVIRLFRAEGKHEISLVYTARHYGFPYHITNLCGMIHILFANNTDFCFFLFNHVPSLTPNLNNHSYFGFKIKHKEPA